MPVGEVTLISVITLPITSMPGEDQTAALQLRADDGAQLQIALGQVRLNRLAAHMHVGAHLAFGWHAIDRAHRLSVHQDDALVAIAHVRHEGLGHERIAADLLEHLHQRGEVFGRVPHPEHARAAIAEQRFDDDVAVVALEEIADLASELVISVGGMMPSKWVMKSFSGASRTWRGSFTTNTSGIRCSRRWVVVI
jgi:hypothetical protein